MEGSNGETDIENRLIDIGWGEEGEGGMHGKSNMETSTTICKIDSMGICCMIQETQTGSLYQPRGVGWGGK